MPGIPITAHTSITTRSARAAAWLGRLADALDTRQQQLAQKLSALIGAEAGLLLMLPIVLMLRPLLALSRALQHSRLLLLICLIIIIGGIAAGPSVGTRFGLILVPIYVLGWICALNYLRTLEALELTRMRLARAGRLVRGRLMPLHAPEIGADRRN